jgi:hypothetical protein
MSTELSTNDDVAIDAAPYKTRTRPFVHHKDGSDVEFWNTSYFIPGITARPRCLPECLSTTQGPPLLSLRSNDTIDRNNDDDDLCFEKEDIIRAWCSPSALLRDKGLLLVQVELDPRESMKQETSNTATIVKMNDDKHQKSKEEIPLKHDDKKRTRSLPNVLLQKENTTPPSKQINQHSDTDLRLGITKQKTMPIEEELRELLKTMRENR